MCTRINLNSHRAVGVGGGRLIDFSNWSVALGWEWIINKLSIIGSARVGCSLRMAYTAISKTRDLYYVWKKKDVIKLCVYKFRADRS